MNQWKQVETMARGLTRLDDPTETLTRAGELDKTCSLVGAILWGFMELPPELQAKIVAAGIARQTVQELEGQS